jgi:hypothetical protein
MTLKDLERALKDPELAGGMHETKLTVVFRNGCFYVQLQDSGWKSENVSGSNLEETVRQVFRAHNISV